MVTIRELDFKHKYVLADLILIRTALLYKCRRRQSAPAIFPTSARHTFLLTALCELRRDGQYWVFLSISFHHYQLLPDRKNLTLYFMVLIETMRHCLTQMLVCNMLLNILLSTPKGLTIIPRTSFFSFLFFWNSAE